MSSWMIRYLPQFGGTIGEDPVKHCQHFHSICSRMKPENETLEGFKLKCFKLSLTDFAIIWYYSSITGCADYYEDLRAQFLKEFSPPSLRHDTRKKIICLQQSRDETLDEYYTYFDIIVSRCPHHGFTNVFLLQKFLKGMRPVERSRLNDAVGGSAMHLTMNEMWDLIDDLAEATKRRPMHQTERAQTIEDDLKRNGEDIAMAMMDESETGSTEEEPTWEITPEPSEDLNQPALEPKVLEPFDQEALGAPETGPVLTDEPSETYPAITAEAAEEINRDQVLTDRLAETEPVLIMKASQLFPLIHMRITAHENDVINGEPENRMEERPKQNDSLMEHSLATTRQGSKKARIKGPATMVKRSSPSRRNVKANPPDQWSPVQSTSFHENLGRIETGAAKKFNLTHPWDPDPS